MTLIDDPRARRRLAAIADRDPDWHCSDDRLRRAGSRRVDRRGSRAGCAARRRCGPRPIRPALRTSMSVTPLMRERFAQIAVTSICGIVPSGRPGDRPRIDRHAASKYPADAIEADHRQVAHDGVDRRRCAARRRSRRSPRRSGTSQPAQVVKLALSGMLIVPGTWPVAELRRAAACRSRARPRRAASVERAARRAESGRGNPPSDRGPSLFTRFISAKYFGGSGWPASTLAHELVFSIGPGTPS